MAGLSDLRVAIIGGEAVMGLMCVPGVWVVIVTTGRFANSFCGAADNPTSHGRTQDHEKVGSSSAGPHRFEHDGALLEKVAGASNINFGAPCHANQEARDHRR